MNANIYQGRGSKNARFFCNWAILHSAYFRTQYNAIIKVTSKAWLPSYAVWLKVKGEGRGGCHMQSEAQIICKYLRNLIKKFWFTKRLNVKARIENKHGGPLLSIKETVRVILLDPHAKIAMPDLQWYIETFILSIMWKISFKTALFW